MKTITDYLKLAIGWVIVPMFLLIAIPVALVYEAAKLAGTIYDRIVT